MRVRAFADQLIESANVMILGLDSAGRVVFFNAKGEAITGYTRRELRGRKWSDVVVALDDQSAEAQVGMARTEAGAVAGELETLIRTKRGEHRRVLWLNSVVDDPDGRPISVSFGIDVTDARATERELAESRAALERRVNGRTADLAFATETLRSAYAEQQALFDASRVGLAITRGRVIRKCNRTLEAMFGFLPGELVGASTRVWYPDDQTYERVGRTLAAEVTAHGRFMEELELSRKDGSRFWARLSCQAIDRHDPTKDLAATVEDISDERRALEVLRQAHEQLRASEQRFAYALDAASDGIWDWFLETGRVYFSPSYERMLGFEPGELGDDVQAAWVDRLHPEDRDRILAVSQKALASHGGYELEFRQRCKDGSYKWILSRGRVVERDAAGNPTRAVGTHVDLGIRKQIEARLREAAETAEAANRAKTGFLNAVSHELRTPMNAILGMAYLLDQSTLTDEQRAHLDRLAGASRTLQALLDDILDYVHVDTTPLERRAFGLADVLRSVADRIGPPAAAKGLSVSVEVSTVAGIRLLGDPARLERALAKLADNAVKFTEAGSVHLVATLAARGEGRVTVRIEVRDTGIGLTATERDRLFQTFQQVDDALTRRHGGTGLGLALAKRVVAHLGGEIGVDSVKGDGSTFWMTVPFDIDTSGGAEAPAPETAGSAPAVVSGSAAASGPADSPGSAAELDPVAFASARARLLARLHDGDAESVDLFAEHDALFRAGLGDRYERVASAVRTFDFAAAIVELELG